MFVGRPCSYSAKLGISYQDLFRNRSCSPSMHQHQANAWNGNSFVRWVKLWTAYYFKPWKAWGTRP